MAVVVIGRAWSSLPPHNAPVTDPDQYSLVDLPSSGGQSEIDRLRDRLNDDDPTVVTATVNIILELAKNRGAEHYLELAPDLFDILTGQGKSGSSNWILIKIVKLVCLLITRRVTATPNLIVVRFSVCVDDPCGTTASPKATSAADEPHSDHASNVSSI
jgi:hypothetical protein